MRRTPTCLIVCAVLFPATAAQADVVTYWNDVVAQALTRAVPARPGPSGLLDFAAVHVAMDAIQAFQGRYEPYAGAIPNASGSPLAAAATAARAYAAASDEVKALGARANTVPGRDGRVDQ